MEIDNKNENFPAKVTVNFLTFQARKEQNFHDIINQKHKSRNEYQKLPKQTAIVFHVWKAYDIMRVLKRLHRTPKVNLKSRHKEICRKTVAKQMQEAVINYLKCSLQWL